MEMRAPYVSLLLSRILFVTVGSAEALWGQDGCSSSCGELRDISYPFRLKGDPSNCGDPDYELVCNGNKTVLEISSLEFLVTNIYHENSTIRLLGDVSAGENCSLPMQSLSVSSFPRSTYIWLHQSADWVIFVNCSKKIENNLYRPITCLSRNNRFVYAASGYSAGDVLPSCGYLTMAPIHLPVDITIFDVDVFQIIRDGFILSWAVPPSLMTTSEIIHECMRRARWDTNDWFRGKSTLSWWLYYPLNFELNFLGCALRSRHHYTGANAFYRLTLVVIIFLIISELLLVIAILCRFMLAPLVVYMFMAYKFREMFVPIDAVEKFLRNQQTLTPTRYDYTDIVAMTMNFKEKLGQGGFGAVFKGEIQGFQLVAVKMLGNSKCNGDEFISEVSTIGMIHHVNVVRLVGFCSEGSNRALVYEFMCNGSLDRHIFSSNGTDRRFTIEKLNEIALGVAKGIDYLHRGCDMRILHFDIKPHNILLDQSFNPKVSDFGLAKLYPKDYSLVSSCAARGTIGYMAPELVSRSFGPISYKSDVYSFGMLLLEMAGGRRNVNQQAENSSQVYYPSWVYDQLEQREMPDFSSDIEIDDVERKLCKVGLWCIQMRPPDRPSLSKVVEMLEAGVDTVDMPPKPFLFSSPALSIRRPSFVDSTVTDISTIYEDE